MGIGIEIRAAYQGHEEDCKKQIRAFFDKEHSIVPGKSITVSEHAYGMQAEIFFAEESVAFLFDTDEPYLTISAKTNGAGPGYHAYLVDLLGRLKISLALSWDEEDVADESEYWHHRDFGDLQVSMASWLQNLASHLVDNLMDDDVCGLALSMDADKVPDDETHYAAHPLGWLERDFFEKIDRDGPTPQDCDAYYVWWDKQPDPTLFLKCALAMMWCDCNWLPPVTDDEKSLFTATLLCLEKAWDDDPGLAYPVNEWLEMADLSSSADIVAELHNRFPDTEPAKPIIGYLRGPVRRHLGSGWRITMPGRMHEETEGDGGTVLVFWNESATIRVTRFTVTGEGIGAESLLASLTESTKDAVPFDLRHNSGVLAKLSHGEHTDGDKKYFCSYLFAAVDDGYVLYISACHEEDHIQSDDEKMFATLSWQTI